jgi:DNA-binding SARP family transcriptional activator/tetratricopeptide (TPR) repeat protein
MEERPLELRLLGEFQMLSHGREIRLPASRKTRALLAYLVATGRPHRREWLCDLLWEGPDDPRAELRWSLTKLRPLLDTEGPTRLKTDRSRVAFEPRHVAVDLTAVRELLADVPNTPLQALKTAIGLFRGEFLDGLDLPVCYRFQEWCLAERAAFSVLRLGAMRALVDRLSDRPEEALAHARALVAADPLSEDGHARVIRLLSRLGRRREAMSQYEQARGVLEREAGVRLSGRLESARHAIGRAAVEPRRPEAVQVEEETAGRERTRTGVPLIGRAAERAAIDRLVSATANGQATSVLLVTGEPGIGKSRLLDHLAERMTMIGGRCLRGRAFEAEAAHSYGAWIDAFRTVSPDMLPADTRQHLALLRPEFGRPPAAPTDRTRLFDSVLSMLRHLAQAAPLALVLDDLQWLDEASSALLHYVVRLPNAPQGLLVACAARSGELADNPPVLRALQTLRRDGRVLELPLAALSAAETTGLVRAIDPGIDAAVVFAQCDGNPFFALELSERHREGRQEPGLSLNAVIADQFATMDVHCRSLVTWASAQGRTFDPGLLGQLTGLQSAALLAALEKLERRGIIRTAGTHHYDFVHDLVRRAAYQAISQPRRKLIHGQIARILDGVVATSDDVAGDLVRHAELAGEHALAARACVVAGERSLRLFANADAMTLARRGRSHLRQLADDRLRRELAITLFRIEVLAAAGPGMRPLPRIIDELTRAVADAEAAKLPAATATGHYLLSVLHQETGDTTRARQSTVRAAEAGRDGEQPDSAQQLANTGRCLIELEAEIPRARALLAEAEALLGLGGQSNCELQWGRGLLARWAGNIDEASTRLECALGLARNAQDRWREYKCVTWLAFLELERGRFGVAKDRCRDLRSVAEQLGESEAPLADTLEALADLAETRDLRLDRLDAALSRLRTVDDKSHLAYALNAAAALCLARQPAEAAKAYAQEAFDAARAVQRQSEIAIADAMLAKTAAGGSAEAVDERLRLLRKQVADHDRFSARARALVEHKTVFGVDVFPVPPLSAAAPEKKRSRR